MQQLPRTRSPLVADFPVCGVEGAEWHMDVEAAQKLLQTNGVTALRVAVKSKYSDINHKVKMKNLTYSSETF